MSREEALTRAGRRARGRCGWTRTSFAPRVSPSSSAPPPDRDGAGCDRAVSPDQTWWRRRSLTERSEIDASGVRDDYCWLWRRRRPEWL